MGIFRGYPANLFVRELVIGTLILVLTVPVIEGQCPISCETVTISSCIGLSYTTTGFPNFLSQNSQVEAAVLGALIPNLVLTNCYTQTQQFLCGLLVPECVADTGLKFPTKSMCTEFLNGCGTTLMALGIPLEIDCNTLPETSTAQCFTVPTVPDIIPTPEPTADGGMTWEPSNTTGECTFQCEEIDIYSCESVPYNYTGFPTLFGHTSMSEVDEVAVYIDIAATYNCYSQSTQFLCGVLLPECTENAGTVLPSKSMCEAFLAGCGIYIAALPGAEDLNLDCTMFPNEINPEPVCYDQLEPTTPKIVTTEIPTPALTTGSSTIFNLHAILLVIMSSFILQQMAW